MTNDKDGAYPCWGTDKEVEQLRAELDAARKVHAQLSKDYHVKHLNYEKLERENAQLAAALRELYEETADYITVNHLGDVHHNQSMQHARGALAGNSTTLRDLLAPTIELLNRLDDDTDSVVLQESIKAELTRLRELCEKGPAT